MKRKIQIVIALSILSACASTPAVPPKTWMFDVSSPSDEQMTCMQLSSEINDLEQVRSEVQGEKIGEDRNISEMRASNSMITDPMLAPFAQYTLHKAEQNYSQRVGYLNETQRKLDARRDHISRIYGQKCS